MKKQTKIQSMLESATRTVKILEKRCELLTSLYDKLDNKMNNCEITMCDYEFLHNNLINIKLELEEIEEAVKFLNMYIK